MPPNEEEELEPTPVELDEDSFGVLERIAAATERTAECLERMTEQLETLGQQLS